MVKSRYLYKKYAGKEYNELKPKKGNNLKKNIKKDKLSRIKSNLSLFFQHFFKVFNELISSLINFLLRFGAGTDNLSIAEQ